MSIFREIPPTAGFAINFKDLFRSLLIFRDRNVSLENDFKIYLNVNTAYITYSGTAALYIILESLKEISSKRTVVIPSYVCPLVPLAIKRAGLRVKVCDTNGTDFGFSIDQLEMICSLNTDILAVIPVHLAGIPVDMDAVNCIAKKYGITVVEDCAQSLGALYKGRQVGTIGEFGFFSLCRGKGLTIYEGGVLVVNKPEYAAIVERKISDMVKNNFLSEALKILELFGYAVFYSPFLFWFVFKLPQYFWNMQGNKLRANIEEYDEDFSIHNVSGMRKTIGHITFNRLREEINRQRQRAFYYIKKLKGIKGLRIIEGNDMCSASYPYLTLVFDKEDKRNKAMEDLSKLGLGVSQIYVMPINGYDYLKDTVKDDALPEADALSRRTLTLSTSTFIKHKDMDLIAGYLLKNS